MQCWLAILASIVLQAVALSPDLTHTVPRHSAHADSAPSAFTQSGRTTGLIGRNEGGSEAEEEQVTSAVGGAEPVAGFSKSVNPVVPPTNWQATADGARGIAACAPSPRPLGGTLQAQHVRLQL
jgi:hypothetical protein